MHRKDNAMASKHIQRRDFLKTGLAFAGAGAATFTLNPSVLVAAPPKRTAADQVTLGKTGLKLSRLGMGTGSHGGRDQRNLGQAGFTKLLRYAYDKGITYIDTADNYRIHGMIAKAIKGLPREKLFIQTKMPGGIKDPMAAIERYLKELGVDYVDSLLTHCATTPGWDEERKRCLDAFEKAKEKGLIKAHGVSCHSLPATTKAAKLDWVDVNLVRINPQGAHMDTPIQKWNAKSDATHVKPVLAQIKTMRKNRHGIIGMKLIGNGDFKKAADRKKAIDFAMQCGLLDAVVIGFKNTAEVDEALLRINQALAAAK